MAQFGKLVFMLFVTAFSKSIMILGGKFGTNCFKVMKRRLYIVSFCPVTRHWQCQCTSHSSQLRECRAGRNTWDKIWTYRPSGHSQHLSGNPHEKVDQKLQFRRLFVVEQYKILTVCCTVCCFHIHFSNDIMHLEMQRYSTSNWNLLYLPLLTWLLFLGNAGNAFLLCR